MLMLISLVFTTSDCTTSFSRFFSTGGTMVGSFIFITGVLGTASLSGSSGATFASLFFATGAGLVFVSFAAILFLARGFLFAVVFLAGPVTGGVAAFAIGLLMVAGG